jgi:hypothetical protein
LTIAGTPATRALSGASKYHYRSIRPEHINNLSIENEKEFMAFVSLLSCFVLIMLIGAVFGIVYAYYGGTPILQFANPDGRLN